MLTSRLTKEQGLHVFLAFQQGILQRCCTQFSLSLRGKGNDVQ